MAEIIWFCACALLLPFLWAITHGCVCAHTLDSLSRNCAVAVITCARGGCGEGGIIFGTRGPLWEQDRNKLLKKYSLLLKRFADVKEQQKHTFGQRIKEKTGRVM